MSKNLLIIAAIITCIVAAIFISSHNFDKKHDEYMSSEQSLTDRENASDYLRDTIGYENGTIVRLRGHSKYPLIIHNSIVIIEYIPFSDIKIGDIIAFNVFDFKVGKELKIIHTVIDITDKGLITKGVNNPKPDPWYITEEMFKSIAIIPPKIESIDNE